MKVEARLKRSPSRKIDQTSPSTGIPFPAIWSLQCFSYASLKCHIRDFEARKKITGGECEEGVSEASSWEHSFAVRLEVEINKIRTFYEETHNECMEGLKNISNEIPAICTIKAAALTHVWHDFILHYNSRIKALETRELPPLQFISSLESYLLLVAEKADPALLNILKRLIMIHRCLLQLKSYAQFNLSGIKKLLRKHDERTEISISTEWTDRIHRENFYTQNSFEKGIAQTKDILQSLTPSVDDFSCAVCLGLLCEPVAITCGHRFCEYCLVVVSNSCVFCPMCRMEQQLHPNNHIPDKQLKAYLKQHFPVDYKTTQREHRAAKRKTMCTIS